MLPEPTASVDEIIENLLLYDGKCLICCFYGQDGCSESGNRLSTGVVAIETRSDLKLLMRPVLNHPALVDQEDLGCSLNAGEPMRHDNNRRLRQGRPSGG